MDIFEKARELGKLILETKEAKNLNAKRFLFEADEQAQKKLNEYSRKRDEINMSINSNSLSDEELAQLRQELKAKAGKIMEDPIIRNMFAAEEEFSALVESVMDILRATIDGDFGDLEGGCTGNCSSCGGCR